MLKNSKKQSGNALIVIIIIIAVVILAGLGFVLWNNIHYNSTPNATNPSTNTTDTNTTTTPKPESLNLADWSIGFTLPSGLKASDVVSYKTHVGEGPDYYGFTTNRVRAQGGTCDNEVIGNLDTLNRSTTKNGSGKLVNDTAIGGYYYYLGSSVDDIDPAPACLQTDIAVQDRAFLNDMIATLSMAE